MDFSVMTGEVSFVLAYQAETLNACTDTRQMTGVRNQAWDPLL